MNLEQHIQLALGQLHFKIMLLEVQLAEANKKLADLETSKKEKK
jgi:hypothetical protein